MFHEKRQFCVKTLSLPVRAIGIAPMAGRTCDFTFLKSIFPSWKSVKFETVPAFLPSSITLYFIVRAHEGKVDSSQAGLSISTLMSIPPLGIPIFSSVLKVYNGAEDFSVKEAPVGVKITVPAQPFPRTSINIEIPRENSPGVYDMRQDSTVNTDN